MKIENVWMQALNILQKEVTAVSFDLWIKSLEPINFKDGIFILSTTSEIAKNRVIKLHGDSIKIALKEISDEIIDFKVLDPDERNNYLKEDLKSKEEELLKANNFNNFNPKYTFDNFVVGSSNKVVYAAARGVAENPSCRINPLFIYGGVGLGKTHLLHAIGNFLNKSKPELKIMYATCEKFTNDYVKSMQSGNFNNNSAFREKYRNLDVLIIDDIQFISNKTGTQEEFFHTFNDLYQSNKQIVIASDRPPRDIATLEERLRSRFSMGLIQDIQTPEYETRVAILLKKAQQENFSIEEDVINFIAEHCDSNIREMEGMLSKVCFYSSLLGKPKATLEDVTEALKDQDFSNKQKLTTDTIIDATCKYFSLKRDDLIGKKRNKEIVEPRQICMYVMCDLLEIPLTSIGYSMGGRDHTTVMHAREKIGNIINTNNRIKVIVSDIKTMATKS